MSPALLQNKNLSVLVYVEAFWWSEATQIRTIALWGIFGGDFIESDGFCAVFVVECNQKFFKLFLLYLLKSASASLIMVANKDKGSEEATHRTENKIKTCCKTGLSQAADDLIILSQK